MADTDQTQGSIKILKHNSSLLRNNPLGDPHVRDLYLYLPPGYSDTDVRYPVVYCLTGFTGRGKMLLNDNAFSPNMAERMDRLIAAGRVTPMIVVMPDCFTKYGGSQYPNSTATGNYEDYITREMVPFVDENFRTIGTRDGRAVMGKSSGGYGALIMGMRHSDCFSMVCATAGDAYFDLCYTGDITKAFRLINGDPKGFIERFWTSEKKGRDDHYALNIIAMSACYSPNGAGYDLLFDIATGEIIDEVWLRWLANDPVRLVKDSVEELRSLKLLFIDAGTRDEFSLDIGARVLSKRLTAHGIAHIHEEFDDGHMGISYRYDRSLELISEYCGQ
ncbi:MAG: alpha/beta hydrolase-fold protein [Acidobacteriota bacterium]